ncbi:MAG TPA: hypothetical protein VNE39_10050 [Planctomycetota bacterium]|nr:hypothetical protein [Planctomycetota bacterium]
MPATVNGIGTTYYGKKNLRETPGTCEHCGRSGKLQSYETRLWFVVVFIPVVPLGRKQILDYCPACRRHKVLPVAEWQRIQNEAVSKAGHELAAAPDDPAAAVEFLDTLVGFQRTKEAADFAQVMARQFPNDATVQFRLGTWHDGEGRGAEADACFARAFELNPNNWQARRAVAVGAIEKGDLARATELLAAMPDDAAAQHAGAFLRLAQAHQERREHEAALGILREMLRRSPGLKSDKAFRKAARLSERAMRQEGALVPKPRLTPARAVALAALAVVAAGVGGYLAWQAASQRGLHIVNRLPAAVSVAIDGTVRASVPPGEQARITVGTGRHRAEMTGGQGEPETVEFQIGGRTSTYVLNPRGAALLLVEEIYYGTTEMEPRRRLHVGKPFLALSGIDYVFEDFPASVRSESGKPLWKRRLVVVELDAVAALFLLRHLVPDEDLLAVAEHHLTRGPATERLLEEYRSLAASAGKLPRCRDFLAKGLGRRPVEQKWHRTYQGVCQALGEHDTLVPLYGQLLAAAPKDSALLYLRGRVAASRAEARDHFDRALAADAKNADAWFCKALDLAAVGDFAAARRPAEEACRLDPDDSEMADLLFVLRRAAGEAAQLEKELRAWLAERPYDFPAIARLAQLLVEKGDKAGAKTVQDAYAKAIQTELHEAGEQLLAATSFRLALLVGDTDAALASAAKLKDRLAGTIARFYAHATRKEPGKAEALLGKLPPWLAGQNHLVAAMAWRESGDEAKAEAQWQQAITAFAARSGFEKRVSELLRLGVSRGEVDELPLDHSTEVILLVGLAERHPDLRGDFLPLAEKLNPTRSALHGFLQRRIEALKVGRQ